MGPITRAIVIQHVPMEGPARIADLATARGLTVEVCEVFAGASVPTRVAADEALIVMGGGMDVEEQDDPRYPFLRTEIALIQSALRDDRAVLGVCLGAQLLAFAAGARVYRLVSQCVGPGRVGRPDDADARVREVGWSPATFINRHHEPALAGLRDEEMVLHWHGFTFDLPPGAVLLASTPLCKHQAFRIGARAFGLQFHVEVDAEIARRWAREDAAFVRSARGPDGPALVIAESDRLAPVARAAGDRLIDNILGCMGA